jgi:transposase InsO family protein
VVIDKFTKYAHFISLSHPFTALQVAQAFMQHVYKLHGLPTAIISDRDKVFTSNLWIELFKLTNTKLLMSTSYHPQTDRQSERLNQCLETFLRCAVHSCPKQWHKWLPLAEYWYNTNYHSSLGYSSFQVLYGHSPRHFEISNEASLHAPDLNQWLTKRHLLDDVVKHHLHRAQQRMKNQADKRRSEREFAIGDLVYLKL